MYLRDIPDSMDPVVVASIDARLAAIRADHNVVIPLAIESGSRAWGFPSPDSDYDCRFIFVRPIDDHLLLWAKRDVIETPLEGELDVNGWELAKAIKLLLKGNAVIVEWLTSPIIYGADSQFRDEFLALARRVLDRDLVARHYLHLGERQRRTYFADAYDIPLKKIFYALRPAAALRWLRHHPGEAVAPMHFQTLMAECRAPNEVMDIVAKLIAKKSITRELGSGQLPPAIGAFIDGEFSLAQESFSSLRRAPSETAVMDAQAFFRQSLVWFGRNARLATDAIMPRIELDAAGWTKVLDFYEALLAALGAPRGHGRNINALIDSMVYGGICEIDPPYELRIRNVGNLTSDIRSEIKLLKECLAEQESDIKMELLA